MGIPINYPGLTPEMVRLIKNKSYTLSGRYGHTPEDREDLEQDMALHILSMLPKHDPERSSLPTFVNRVVDSWCRMLARERGAACRGCGHRARSLDEPACGSGEEWETSGDLIGETDAVTLSGSKSLGCIEAVELRLAVESTIESLPEHLQDICNALKTQTVSEVSASTGIPRTTIASRVKLIRQSFEKAGLGTAQRKIVSSKRRPGAYVAIGETRPIR